MCIIPCTSISWSGATGWKPCAPPSIAGASSPGWTRRTDDSRAALYVKDGLAEEWAFSSVRDDVPGLRDQAAWDALERVVRHAADVEPVLRRALKEAGLEFVGIRFLNGQVELAGEFDSDQQRRLSETLDAVSAELGVPVTFSVVPSFARADAARGRTSFVPEQEPRPVAAPESAADPLGGTQVTGVTLSPMKFISLSNGQRIFEGGLLPEATRWTAHRCPGSDPAQGRADPAIPIERCAR